MNKSFFIKLFSFIGICLIGIFGSGWLDNKNKSSNFNVLKARQSYRFDSLDYLFVGSSITYASINPVYFDSIGLKAFNFGISTAGPQFYEILIDDYLKHTTQKPKNVVLLLHPVIFTNKADDFKTYPIHRYLKSPIGNFQLAWKYNMWIDYPGLLHKSSIKGFHNLHTFITGKKFGKNTDPLSTKGFYPSMETYREDGNNHEGYYGEIAIKDFEEKTEKLVEVAEKYRNQGMNIIFHEVPDFKLRSHLSKNLLERYNSFLEKIKNDERYDFYNTYFELDSTHFRDYEHMNNKGADVYTKYFINQIKR